MNFCRPFPLTEFLEPKNPDHNLNIYIQTKLYIRIYIYHIISYHIISYIYINSIHIPLGFLRVSFHVVEQCRTFQLVHLVASFAMMFVWVHAGRKREMQGYFHHLVGQPIHLQKPWDHLDLFIWWRDTNFLMTGSQFSIIHQLSTHFPHILRSRQVGTSIALQPRRQKGAATALRECMGYPPHRFMWDFANLGTLKDPQIFVALNKASHAFSPHLRENTQIGGSHARVPPRSKLVYTSH